jgi:hypothetical protein
MSEMLYKVAGKPAVRFGTPEEAARSFGRNAGRKTWNLRCRCDKAYVTEESTKDGKVKYSVKAFVYTERENGRKERMFCFTMTGKPTAK